MQREKYPTSSQNTRLMSMTEWLLIALDFLLHPVERSFSVLRLPGKIKVAFEGWFGHSLKHYKSFDPERVLI